MDNKKPPAAKRKRRQRDSENDEKVDEKVKSSTMEEPKALLPNGHSESHSDETPQPMEVDNEPDVKPDIKIEVKRSKSLDTPIAADDASDSSAPAHNPSNESDQSQASDASSASKESAAEPPPPPSSSSSSSSEKSAASKKKVPQKILKRSPRISRNREPSEDESSNKAEDEKLKLESIVEEKAEKESDESEKKRSTSVEEVNKDETEKGTKEETNKEISVKKEKVDDSKMDEHMEPHTSGFSEEVFLGFEDKAESYNKLNRDTIYHMIDAITASTPGQSRSRRSVKRDVVSKDVENKKDSEKAKSDKKEAETAKDEVKKENKEHLSDWFDRKIQERLSPHPNYYANDEDYDSGGVSNDILIPEVVYMTGPGSHSSAKDGDASKRSSTPATSQSSKKRRRAREKGGGSRRNYDVSLPQFLKPFEYGWKREIVYRNNSETYSKRIGDVYYHTPLGKKIRSIGLVKDYLLGTDLTLENFTFVVKPIVSDDPTKEFISRSKPKLEKEAETPPPLPKRGAALAAASSLKSATKSGNGGPEAGDAAKVETSIDKNSAVESSSSSSSSSLPASSSSPKPSLNSTPKIAFRSFKSSPKPKPTKQLMPEKKGKKYSEDENEKEELEMGMLPPLWKSPTHSDWSANGGSTMELTSSAKRCGDGGDGVVAVDDDEDGEEGGAGGVEAANAGVGGGGGGGGGGDHKLEVCTIRCPQAVGVVPQLQCVICLCLYHPECVGAYEARHRTIHCYVCKNCQDAKKPGQPFKHSQSFSSSIHTSPPPLVPLTSTNQTATESSTPQLHRLLDGTNTTPKPSSQQQQKIVGGVTTWLPPSSMIQLTTSKNTTTAKMSSSAPPVASTVESSSINSMPAQTLLQMNGKRYVVVPKHNVLSVSPAATKSSDNQAACNTLAPTTTGNSVLVSPGCVTMPPLLQNPVASSFLATSLMGGTYPQASVAAPPATPTMSHAYIMSPTVSTTPQNNPAPAGVLLVPCITTTPGIKDLQQKFLIVQNGLGPVAGGGNFLIGNLPPQHQPALPAVPTTQPAVPSTESEKGRKRQLEETDAGTPPPAKQAKVDSTDATDRTPTPTLTPPDAANATPEATPKTPPTTEAALPTPSPDVAAVKSENVEAVTSQKSVTAVTSQKSVAAVTSQKSVGVGVTSQAFPPHPAPSSSVSVNKEFFMTNVSAIYHALLNSFQYLNVQELLRAARVCHMWRDVALNRSLWHVVRMKNSRVRDWDGFASTLRSVGAKQLDLRKMLVPDRGEEVGRMWREYARAIHQVNSLYRLDLCRCPSHAIEQSLKASPRLQYLSALAIKSSSLDAAAFENCKNLTELRFKCSEKGGLELENVASLKNLTKMKHLSLTTMKSFPPEFGEVLENMKDLETLELGECTSLSKSVALSLSKLKGLQRLRLEKGQGSDCPTITILESIRDLESLKQLELINFDIKAGFDETISKCIHLRTLLIIPTYVTQSATTNHVVMEGVSKLAKTLTLFVWGITLELLKVTDLFIDQWEGQKGANKGAANPAKKGSGDSIPILKPIAENNSKEIDAPSQVDILQLPKLHKVLTSLLPTTKVKILKVPFAATWRQTVSGPAHIH